MESLKNLDTAFRRVQSQARLTVICAVALSIAACYLSFDYVQTHSDKMWVMLSDGQAVQVASSSMQDNRLAEARHHLEFYHFLTFNISPDPQSIEYNRRRAEYLGDNTILVPYEKKKESGFYNRLIAGNMRQEFRLDSISDREFPLMRVYGKEIITRSSSQLTKSLVSSCRLINMGRSDNNANGFFITEFVILENEKLTEQNRY